MHLAIGLGVASLPAVPLVQWIARRLPFVPLGKWPAVYLSVALGFVLAASALAFASIHLRALERRPDERLLPSAIVFIGLVLLVAGMVFATVADFVRPRSPLLRLIPPASVIVVGLAGMLGLSGRARAALKSEDGRRVAEEVLRYVEVLEVVGIIVALLTPNGRHLALVVFSAGGMLSPAPIFLGYRLNLRRERFTSLKCRWISYAVGVPFPLIGWFILPAI